MTNATNRVLERCKVCGCTPSMYVARPPGQYTDGTDSPETLSWLNTANLTDDGWLNGAFIEDNGERYVVKCHCSATRYDSPAAAAEAWNRSGPTVTTKWWRDFIALVDRAVGNPELRDNLIEHVASHIAAPEVRYENTAGPVMPDEPEEHKPIGYISESAKLLLQQGTKAFIRPQRDSLSKLPVYVGKPE